jgi:hypothetical protein
LASSLSVSFQSSVGLPVVGSVSDAVSARPAATVVGCETTLSLLTIATGTLSRCSCRSDVDQTSTSAASSGSRSPGTA